MAPLFPVWKGNGPPIMDMRRTVEGIAWRFRTGAPWRDLPEEFGLWALHGLVQRRYSSDVPWKTPLTRS